METKKKVAIGIVIVGIVAGMLYWLSKGAQAYTYSLTAGWNLITMRLYHTPYTGKTLYEAIPNCQSVAYWDGAGWTTYSGGVGGAWAVIDGEEYFVKVSTDTEWTPT